MQPSTAKGDGFAIISKKGVVTELHKKTQNNNIQFLTAKNSRAVAIYVTAVYMKPNAPVNDSSIPWLRLKTILVISTYNQMT